MIVDSILAFKNKEMTPSAPLRERNISTDAKMKIIVGACATLILMSSLIISVCALLRLKHVEEEVANLRWEISQLKLSDREDSRLIDDLKDFENEELYSQIESDYDINYENLASLLDSEEDNVSDGNQSEIPVDKNNANKARNKRDIGIPSIVRHGITEQGEQETWTKNDQNQGSLQTAPPPPPGEHMQPERLGRMRKRRAKSSSRQQWEPVGEDAAFEEPIEPRRRNRHRQKNNIEIFDEKPRTVHVRTFPAIQLVGDTSKYIIGQHTNYNGNGHLQHRNPTYVDWIANEWVQTTNMDKHFEVNDGTVKVKENGLYFVYAQIFYLDEHDTNGYRVYKNKEVFLQCTTMTHSTERIVKGNTCYTGGLVVLSDGDEVNVQDLGTGRYSIFEPGKSFFGLIKIADVKVK